MIFFRFFTYTFPLPDHSIAPDLLAHREELSQSAGDEISRIINDQRALEVEYEALMGKRVALSK